MVMLFSTFRSLTALMIALGTTPEDAGGAMVRVEAVISATSESAGDSKSSSSSSSRFQATLLSARLNAFAKHWNVTSPSYRPCYIAIDTRKRRDLPLKFASSPRFADALLLFPGNNYLRPWLDWRFVSNLQFSLQFITQTHFV